MWRMIKEVFGFASLYVGEGREISACPSILDSIGDRYLSNDTMIEEP